MGRPRVLHFLEDLFDISVSTDYVSSSLTIMIMGILVVVKVVFFLKTEQS